MIKSIKTMTVLIIVVLITFLIAGSSWISYNQSKKILEQSIIDAANRGAEQNARIITNWLLATARELNALSETPAIKSMDWSKQLPVFEGTLKAHDDYEMMFVVDENGWGTFSTGGEGDLSDRPYVKRALQTGETAFSEPLVSRATGARVIAIAYPIFTGNNNKPVGLVAATVQLNYLQELVKEMKLNGYGYGWIISRDMTTIAHPEDNYLGNKDILTDGNEELRNIASRMASGETGIAYYELNGVEKVMAFAPIELTGWSIAMGAETDRVLAPLNIIKKSSFLLGLISILLGIIVAYFIARFIANPVVEVTGHAELIASGDLSRDVPEIFLQRKDEIGRLAGSFDRMTKNLREMIGSIAGIAKNLEASSKELSASGEQVGETAEQVGSAIQNVASGAEEQSAQIEETTKNIEHMTGQIQQLSSSADNMNGAAGNVMEQIKVGNHSVKKSIKEIDVVKTDTEEVAGIIRSLGKASEEIGGIIEIINGIASQTNLLALNAAIEAARAGEAGRGFSVVADEIRELAEESTSSTEKIANLIKQIQRDVAGAVSKMDENLNTVNSSVKSIEENGKVFNEINEVAGELMKMIGKVRENANELADNSNKVAEVVANISAVSQEAASNAEEVAASSEEQIAATEEIVAGARSLAEMADSLTSQIEKFKL